MKYRGFGKTGWDVSILGFGVMALPYAEGDGTHFDETESIRMIRNAIDQGVNYIDSGYPYDMGQEESRARLLHRALQDDYGKKIRIAATLPVFQVHSRQDFDRCLNDQIRWLQVEKIDFYMLGWLNRENWPGLRELGVLPWAEQAIKDGRIDHLGFSFYDDFQCLRTILDDYDHWHFCQFRYSYMDMNNQPGTGGLKYAADRGLAVVVSEPLRGGRLAKAQPASIEKVWADHHGLEGRTLAEWGLKWVWDHPEVSVAVVNMSSKSQVEEYVSYAAGIEPDSLSIQEKVLISRVREAYKKSRPIPCTACRACMPCPLGIDVPRIFEIYNDAVLYDDTGRARIILQMERHDIDACTACESCVDACAKGLDLIDYLNKVNIFLSGNLI